MCTYYALYGLRSNDEVAIVIETSQEKILQEKILLERLGGKVIFMSSLECEFLQVALERRILCPVRFEQVGLGFGHWGWTNLPNLGLVPLGIEFAELATTEPNRFRCFI